MNQYWPHPDARAIHAANAARDEIRETLADREERFREPLDEEVEWILRERERRDMEQDHGGYEAAVDDLHEAEWAARREWREDCQ